MRGETYNARVTKNINVSGLNEEDAKTAVVAEAVKDSVGVEKQGMKK